MKDFYNPRFNKNAKGGYNEKSAMCSIKGGSDAYLLENELNELQWILKEDLRSLIKMMTNSGCLNVGNNGSQSSGLIAEMGKDKLNSFCMYPFEAILCGSVRKIYSTNGSNRLIITLDEPPTERGKDRYDLVYLEFWETEVSCNDSVHAYGGLDNDILNDYNIKDPEINVETSMRVQFQWRIKKLSGIDYSKYSNGFEDVNRNVNPDIIPMAKSDGTNSAYAYETSLEDKNIYVAGHGDKDSSDYLGTVDGYVYAMPLTVIYRMNSAGYDPIDNPNGSQNYVDGSSIPENNNKYSNVIYKDDIVDLRQPAYVGADQFADIFVKNDSFNDFSTTINNYFDTNFNSLSNTLQQLYDYVHIDIKNDLDLKAYKSELKVYVDHFQDLIDSLTKKVNKNIEMLDDHEERLKKVEEFLKKVGHDPDTEDFLKYGIPIRRRNIFVPGGELQENSSNEKIIVSDGVEIEAKVNNAYDYAAAISLYEPGDGKIGEVWYDKADSTYLIKNTGEYGLAIKTFCIDLLNATMVRSGTGTFRDGGFTLNEYVSDTDFIIVTPIECMRGENGDISVECNPTTTVIKNTGNFGNKFDWMIIDTTKLRNVELINIEVDNDDKSVITGDFGQNFDVMVGTIHEITTPGTIGEVYVTRSFNSFVTNYTGEAKCKFRCLVFKDINLTN